MAMLGRASPADLLSASFTRAVRARAADQRPVVGIEHEYRVVAGDGRPVDFRQLVGNLPLAGVRLDPSDSNAIRGPWGGAITADGPEAEIAVAPVAIEPGFSNTAMARARLGRERLQSALPQGLDLEGYSTHVSVEVADRIVERAALRFARVFAPALMLLLDGPGSPGLLVRPRPGRLELGGEFADGDRLRAATLFATGCARATAASLDRRPWRRTRLPSPIRLELEPATERFGWFVSRHATGSDVYAAGRGASLTLERGGRISAQRHLERCWAVARRALHGRIDSEELDLVDAFVLGGRPLGLEVEHERAVAIEATAPSAPATALDSPFGSAVAIRQRGNLRVEPALVSWDFVVLRISGPAEDGLWRDAYACLPRDVLGSSLEALDAGDLDEVLRDYLSADGPGDRLSTASQTRSPGLYRSVGTAARLLRSEHGPVGTGERPGKRHRESRETQEQASQSSAGSSGPPAAAAPAAAAVAAFTILGLPAAAAAAVAGITAVAVLGGVMLLGAGVAPSPSSAAIGSPASIPTATAVTVPVPPFNFAGVDVCELLDETDVQEITGESSVGFTNMGSSPSVNGGDCFWGATRAGFPAYVDIGIGNSGENLTSYNFEGQTCTESPVEGVGTRALGGTCPAPPQRKVYLVAMDQGVQVRLLVNEPERPLEPDDLAVYVNRILETIRSTIE